MEQKEIAWIMVRATGLWLLILGLQVIPSLVLSLPEIANILLSWDMLAASNSWQTLLSHGPVAHSAGILTKLIVYLGAAFYLIGRGEGLIRLLSDKN